MKLILVISLFILNLNQEIGLFGVAARTTFDRIESAGYSSELHNVVTTDGFSLAIFRIKNSSKPEPRPVVLMMHGLTSSSDCWVIGRPEDKLAFSLVDSGYDVWLGNCRGTPYGTRHKSLSVKDPKFWRFSWHEIGTIDLPNTIDYILKETGQSSMHYVGHSQGTTIMFVLLSTQPEYNKKLKTSHMLAPVVFMKHVRSPLIRLSSRFLGTYSPLDPLVGDAPLLQQPFWREALSLDRCQNPEANYEVCSFVLFTINGGYSGYFNRSLLPEIFKTHPASCSTHQTIHYVQLHVSGRFRQYDFGVEGNQQRYNRATPPDYKLENINLRFPLHLYYSDYDEFSSKTDVENLSRILGNGSVNHFINLKHFAHLDFLIATNVKDVIYRGLLESINKAEQSDSNRL